MNEVSTTIKLLRTEKGINQEQLAEQLHVTRQAVSSWETGKTQRDIETMKQIAEKGFETERLSKEQIKRLLGIYFGATMDGDKLPDVDGQQHEQEDSDGTV